MLKRDTVFGTLRNIKNRLFSTRRNKNNSKQPKNNSHKYTENNSHKYTENNSQKHIENNFLKEKNRICSEIFQEIKKKKALDLKYKSLEGVIQQYMTKTGKRHDIDILRGTAAKISRDAVGKKLLLEHADILEHHKEYSNILKNALYDEVIISRRFKYHFHLYNLINEHIYFLIKKMKSFLLYPTLDKWDYIKIYLFGPAHPIIMNYSYNIESQKKIILQEANLNYLEIIQILDYLKSRGYNYRLNRFIHLDLLEKLENFFELSKEYGKTLPPINTLAESDSLHLIINYHGGIEYQSIVDTDILRTVNIPNSLHIYKLMYSTYGTLAIITRGYWFFRNKNINYDEEIKTTINRIQSNLPLSKNIEKSSINILKKIKSALRFSLTVTKTVSRPFVFVASLLPDWFVNKETKINSLNHLNHADIHIHKLDKMIVYKAYQSSFYEQFVEKDKGFYLITKHNVLNLLYYLDLDIFFDYDNCMFEMNTEEILCYLSHYCKHLSIIDFSCSVEYRNAGKRSVNNITRNAENTEGKSIKGPINNIPNNNSGNVTRKVNRKNKNNMNNSPEEGYPEVKGEYHDSPEEGYPEVKGEYHDSPEVKVPHHNVHAEAKVPHHNVNAEAKVPHHNVHAEAKVPHHNVHAEAKVPHHNVHAEAKVQHHNVHAEAKVPHHNVHAEAKVSNNQLFTGIKRGNVVNI
jgi:hypothetical protein